MAVSKTRNRFRDNRNKRLSAKEMMRASHLRAETGMETKKVEKKIITGLHSLLQTCYIFFTYRMVDGSSILDNIA